MAPITECTKKGSFTWTKEAQKTFEIIIKAMCNPPVLKLPDFSNLSKWIVMLMELA